MKILAVIVTYHPDLDRLRRNISAFCDGVDHILLWDNSECALSVSVYESLCGVREKLTYKHSEENVGISAALNHGWRFASENGFDTLLTMDDDSVFEDFAAYRQHVEALWEEGLCLCGPRAQEGENRGMRRVPHLITSGMLVPVSLVDEAGGWCEDFFVDGIDIDLCINLRRKKFFSYCDTDSRLCQRYGTPATRRLWGLTLRSPNYSAERLHDIFRNHIIILRKYHYPLDLLWHIIRLYFIGFVLKGVLLVESGKKAKLKAVWQGIKDGIKYKINSNT